MDPEEVQAMAAAMQRSGGAQQVAGVLRARRAKRNGAPSTPTRSMCSTADLDMGFINTPVRFTAPPDSARLPPHEREKVGAVAAVEGYG
jgi:hypothetical protein